MISARILAATFLVLSAPLYACSEQAVGAGNTIVDPNNPNPSGSPNPTASPSPSSNPNNPPNTPPVIPPARDTDGDGVPDAQEDRNGNGMVDPGETSPTSADTDSDGVPDVDEVEFQVCSERNERKVTVHDVPGADAMLMVDSVVADRAYLTTADGKIPGLQVFDPSTGVAAILIGKRPAGGVAAPSAQRENERRNSLDDLGAVTLQQTRAFTTVEGFPAEQATFLVRSLTQRDAKSAAAALATAMLGGAPLSGALAAGGGGERELYVSLLTVLRPQRVVLVAAISAGMPSDNAAIRMEELTDGTNVARHGSFSRHICDQLEATAEAKADIIFVVDDSGSMEDDQQALAAAADAMGDVLATAQIDYRLGVARMFAPDQNSRNRGDLENDRLTTNLNDFRNDIVVGASGGWEPGLETGILAIDKLLPKTAVGAPVRADKLREDAAVVVVVLSDERDQAMECAACGDCNQTGQDFCTRSQGQGVIDDFTRQYRARNAVLFSIVGDLPNGCQQTSTRSDFEPGQGYVEVANATGGKFGSLCGDMRQNLADVARVASGVASAYELSTIPASSSIKVAIGRPGAIRIIPRSRVDGFDYDSVQNKIIFNGASRPSDGDKVIIGYRRWDFADDPRTPVDPCDDCAANSSCLPSLNTVDCQPICGAVICVAGDACSIDSGTCGQPGMNPPPDACRGMCDVGQVCNPSTSSCQPPCEQTGCMAPLTCSVFSHLCEIPPF